MRLRRSTVEHPFGTLKYSTFGHRQLLRGVSGARIEIALASMAYNLQRIVNLLGASKLTPGTRLKQPLTLAKHRKAKRFLTRAPSSIIAVSSVTASYEDCQIRS